MLKKQIREQQIASKPTIFKHLKDDGILEERH